MDDNMEIRVWNYGFERSWVHETDTSARSPYLRRPGPGEKAPFASDIFACAMLFLALALAGSDLACTPGKPEHENPWAFFCELTTLFRGRRDGTTPPIPLHFSHLRSYSTPQANGLWVLILKMTEADARDLPSMKEVVQELHAIRDLHQ